jgi:D-alanyl-D-alanine carboxypeptidase/D-alanyl-D-alanine-endopeptidase (penicillin-binding protein 4)
MNIKTQAMILKHNATLCSICILFLVLASCKSPETSMKPEFSEPDASEPVSDFFRESDVFSQSLTGFVLYDPEADSVLFEKDGSRFFIPASNMKIFTLYASLKILPDTLPSLRYTVRNDTLRFRGTGDPAFLNPDFEQNKVYNFLKERPETLVYYDNHFEDDHFGAGWPWDWYPASYAPEKSPFPMYGNMMRLQVRQISSAMLNEEEPVKPPFFKRYIENQGWDGDRREVVRRDYQTNSVFYSPGSDTIRLERNIPFIYDSGLITEMLADTLGRPVGYSDEESFTIGQTLFATPADTLYKRLMQASDNFVAEQLMLMISESLYGTLNTEDAISYSLENHFKDLPQLPQWRDGSGLTRYNLVTPRSIVFLLDKLMDEYGESDVLNWFPAGGVNGTIEELYRAPDGEEPYVYAKTGTLSNNTALSGYLYTDSGRRLIFSTLHNNYVISNSTLRLETERLLERIKQTY